MRRHLLLTVLLTAISQGGSAGSAVGQSTALPAAPREASNVASDGADAEDTAEPLKKYVRVRRNERKAAIALETSIVHFGRSRLYPSATVDLVGAIHLGELEYYQNLNQLFKNYDTVLFEAVMPAKAVQRGLRPGGGGRRVGLSRDWTDAQVGLYAIGTLQDMAKDVVGLEGQMEIVNYWARNFVHADMTQEEMEAAMKSQSESFSLTFAREGAKEAVRQQNISPIAQNLDMLFSVLASDRKYRLRRIGAVQLEQANNGDAFAGPDGTSTIITGRNTKALSVLKTQLRRGQRKLAIFYGAGHFPDMEPRLVKEFGFERLSEKWVKAWDLVDPNR